MAYNFYGAQKRTDHQIRRFGISDAAPGAKALLKNIESGETRECIAAIVDFKPHERGLVEEGARRILISRLDPNGQLLAVPPDHQADKVRVAGAWYNFVAPIQGPNTAGVFIFFDGQVVLGDE